METLVRSWQQLWYAEKKPQHLGIVRFAVCCVVLWTWDRGVPEVFYQSIPTLMPTWWRPHHMFKLLGIGMPSVPVLFVARKLFVVCIVLTAIGLFTRVSSMLAALSGLFLIALRGSLGPAGHVDHMSAMSMVIFAVSPSGDAFSLDSLIAAARARRKPALARRIDENTRNGEYAWPIQLLCVLSALVCFMAGIAKLRHGGIAWITSNNLWFILRQFSYPISKPAPPTALGTWVAHYPLVCNLLAAGTVVFEIAMIIPLFWRRSRYVLIFAMFLSLVSFHVLVGPFFPPLISVLVFAWFDWDRLGPAVRSRATVRGHFLFDGDCGVCQDTVAVLRRLAVLGNVQFSDARNEWAAIAPHFPTLVQSECLVDIHYVDGDAVYTGFRAYRALARRLPLLWLVLPFLYLPGVAFVGQRVYRAVADNRGVACEVPPA